MKSKQLRLEHEAEAIASASYFTVCWFVGRGPTPAPLWERKEFPSLSAAREGKRDTAGRVGIVYAVTPSGMTIHVE